jgi:hypothetical protein
MGFGDGVTLTFASEAGGVLVFRTVFDVVDLQPNAVKASRAKTDDSRHT